VQVHGKGGGGLRAAQLEVHKAGREMGKRGEIIGGEQLPLDNGEISRFDGASWHGSGCARGWHWAKRDGIR
jgi:hypothetical protein